MATITATTAAIAEAYVEFQAILKSKPLKPSRASHNENIAKGKPMANNKIGAKVINIALNCHFLGNKISGLPWRSVAVFICDSIINKKPTITINCNESIAARPKAKALYST